MYRKFQGDSLPGGYDHFNWVIFDEVHALDGEEGDALQRYVHTCLSSNSDVVMFVKRFGSEKERQHVDSYSSFLGFIPSLASFHSWLPSLPHFLLSYLASIIFYFLSSFLGFSFSFLPSFLPSFFGYLHTFISFFRLPRSFVSSLAFSFLFSLLPSFLP